MDAIGKKTGGRPFGEKCSRPNIKIDEIDGNRYCWGYLDENYDVYEECRKCKKSVHHKDFDKTIMDNMAEVEVNNNE